MVAVAPAYINRDAHIVARTQGIHNVSLENTRMQWELLVSFCFALRTRSSLYFHEEGSIEGICLL